MERGGVGRVERKTHRVKFAAYYIAAAGEKRFAQASTPSRDPRSICAIKNLNYLDTTEAVKDGQV